MCSSRIVRMVCGALSGAWRRWRARGGLQDLAALVVAIGVAVALFIMLVF